MSNFCQSINWDHYAECYDALNSLLPYQEMLETVIRQLSLQSGPILDAGCGTGNLMRRFIESFPDRAGDINGVDASVHMLARAKDKLGGSVRVGEADLNRPLALENDSFNCVCCINALYALCAPEAALREFHRVLQSGSSLIIVTPKWGYENGYILKSHSNSQKPKSYWRALHASPEREESLIQEACNEPELVRKFIELARYNRSIAADRNFHFFSRSELVDQVKSAGFIVTHVKYVYAKQNLLLVAHKS